MDKCLECMEEICKTKYKNCKFYLEYLGIKDKTLKLKFVRCNKNLGKKV